jgi:hypothetical protein
MAVASSDEIGVPTFDEHACSIHYNIHSLHVEEFLRSPSVMQGIEPELRIILLSELDSRENITVAFASRSEVLSSDIAVTEDRLWRVRRPGPEVRVWR